jgi:hypothetical protein
MEEWSSNVLLECNNGKEGYRVATSVGTLVTSKEGMLKGIHVKLLISTVMIYTMVSSKRDWHSFYNNECG